MPELLIKYLFTSDKLSVQCHPSNEQTEAKGLGKQGKEECWLVIDAEPGAVLGIGFERHVDPDEMRAAALDGSIEQLLTWHEVKVGDFFYIPANTVHAIGGGCSIIEIQQNSATSPIASTITAARASCILMRGRGSQGRALRHGLPQGSCLKTARWRW